MFVGCDGSRRHGEHVAGSIRDGERGAFVRRGEDGGPDREGRPYGRLQQNSHGSLVPGLRIAFRLTSYVSFITFVLFMFRETAQKTQPRKAAFPEMSRTPTPLTRTPAAKQHGSQESWLKRWCQWASHREVSDCLSLHHKMDKTVMLLSYALIQRLGMI